MDSKKRRVDETKLDGGDDLSKRAKISPGTDKPKINPVHDFRRKKRGEQEGDDGPVRKLAVNAMWIKKTISFYFTPNQEPSVKMAAPIDRITHTQISRFDSQPPDSLPNQQDAKLTPSNDVDSVELERSLPMGPSSANQTYKRRTNLDGLAKDLPKTSCANESTNSAMSGKSNSSKIVLKPHSWVQGLSKTKIVVFVFGFLVFVAALKTFMEFHITTQNSPRQMRQAHRSKSKNVPLSTNIPKIGPPERYLNEQQLLLQIGISYLMRGALLSVLFLGKIFQNSRKWVFSAVSVLLIVEVSLLLLKASLPTWFAPKLTGVEIVWLMHKVFPVFLIAGLYFSDFVIRQTDVEDQTQRKLLKIYDRHRDVLMILRDIQATVQRI